MVVEHAIGRIKRFARMREYENTFAEYGENIKGSETDGLIRAYRRDFNVVIGLVNLHVALDDIKAGRGPIGQMMVKRLNLT